jgi:hypothetical protein
MVEYNANEVSGWIGLSCADINQQNEKTNNNVFFNLGLNEKNVKESILTTGQLF